jgi:hypothetical protein
MPEEKRADLRGRSLFIAIPAYDGKLNIKTAFALAQLMPKAMSLGVSVFLSDMSNCSIITMARNALVNEFLKTDATDMLFIDSDVIVTPDDVLRLLAQHTGRDVTAGIYPRRAKDKRFFLDVFFDESGDLVFDGSLMRIRRIGTGFMMISRGIIEKMIAANPQWQYMNKEGTGNVAAVFDFAIKDGNFVGEDYLFCDRVTELGGKIWLDVDICLPHIGTEAFTNNFRDEVLIPMLGNIRQSKLKVANG